MTHDEKMRWRREGVRLADKEGIDLTKIADDLDGITYGQLWSALDRGSPRSAAWAQLDDWLLEHVYEGRMELGPATANEDPAEYRTPTIDAVRGFAWAVESVADGVLLDDSLSEAVRLNSARQALKSALRKFHADMESAQKARAFSE